MHPLLSNKNICFVTSKDHPDLTESDRIAAEALRHEGARVAPAIWDDPSIDWTRFDAIIIRSTWDYHLHPSRFVSWLDLLERQQLPVWNPVTILRWNMDKRYLLDLEAHGIPIPRTCFLNSKESFDVASVRSLIATDEVVMKPTVSASAWNTWRCSLKEFSNNDRQKLSHLLSNTSVMVQEYMPEIKVDGEWSLMFFGKKISHAVRKYPASGDFRVQDELGGHYRAELNPPSDLVRQALEVLATIEEPFLYARVDGIARAEKLIVMELELLEPSLFFDANHDAAKRFCEQVAEVMGAHWR